jgi:gentisate 1,2-dioxygenase
VGHALEFLNPAGFDTKARGSSDGSAFTVVEGEGTLTIEGEGIDLSPRDTFCIPSWKEVRFHAAQTLVLFAFSDKASRGKLNPYREWNA